MEKNKIIFFAHVKDKALFRDVSFYEQDIRTLREVGYDVIESNSLMDFFKFNYNYIFVWWWSRSLIPILFSKILRVPLIFSGAFHYSTPLMKGSDYVRNGFLYQWLCRLGLKYGDANIFPSKHECDQVVGNLDVTNPNVVYHGIDIHKYMYCERSFDFTKVCPELLVISWIEVNNIERKCLYELVDALNLLHKKGIDFNLNVLGRIDKSGSEFVSYCKSLECSDKITFLGHVSEDIKLDKLKSCHIYVSPTRYEGFGVAIAEAMATGCVVVTSPHGAVPEIASDAVIYANPFDSVDIANQVEKILLNSDVCVGLSKAASARIVNNFSYERHKESLSCVVKKYFIEK